MQDTSETDPINLCALASAVLKIYADVIAVKALNVLQEVNAA
ncbi:hypothetical protein Z946_3702 [Sulfitobacter noctilucicola]|nr:hypothetical protein [Sulfitobacter noctilucicola]KIN64809.1 hypothetical protein Z946_3702 [Sulfitobacter noctilucicola]